MNDFHGDNLTEMTLAKLSSTLIKLDFDTGNVDFFITNLSFIAKFTNLQELYWGNGSFKSLEHVIFPQLQILKFKKYCPYYITRFLENHGKHLKEIYVCNDNVSINLDIAKHCPNLKSLGIIFQENEVESLKAIL